jgi:DNA-binding CsgD family transcriptional regulator
MSRERDGNSTVGAPRLRSRPAKPRLAESCFRRGTCHDRLQVSGIVGRDAEVASLHAFAGNAERPGTALAIMGDAGIGKSTLWDAAVAHAREQEALVLSSRPAEADRALDHAGLIDLFDSVMDGVLALLLPPRRRALEVVLLREESSGDPLDHRALGVAVRDVLEILGERGRTVIAVDDVQWLDPSSSRVLAFALRRLDSSAVSLLLARRLVAGAQPSELEQAFGVDRIRPLVVGPLSVGALHRILRDRLGTPFPRQTLLRIHEQSGGNPLFALELARALPANVDPLEPFPVPETVEEVLRARISVLPRSTRDALACAAALGTTSESALEPLGVTAESIDAAVAERVVERKNGLVHFTHPLLSAVVYADLGEEERRSIHARIADVLDDAVLRARHLALATEPPDRDVANLVADAGRLATDRGASALGAELADWALRLTPAAEADERRRRALSAARAHLAAGEWTHARTIATELLAETESGPLRAETLLLLATFEHDDLAVPVLQEALTQAASDARLRARIQLELALAERFRTGFAAAFEETRAALELAEGLDDDVLCFDTLVQLYVLGRRVGAETARYVERARQVATAAGDPRMLREANMIAAMTLAESGGIDAGRAHLEREHEEWRERDELFSADLLWELSWVELWGRRWELAAEYAARARDIRLQYGVERNQDYIPSAWIAVHRGLLELALDESRRGLKLSEEQIGFHPPLLAAVPGLVALWRGDAATAVARLGDADRQAAALGWGAPETRPWTADYVEALLELGSLDEAVRVLDGWEADAVRLGPDRVLAEVGRCRGVVAAARGDVDEAVALLEHAVDGHEQLGDSFGRARAFLALGIARRRKRQKRAAREAIRAALAGFESLGAATWAERARAELGRIGGRTREEGLSAAERRVAALVAVGHTNHEVAAALFLAERTVASHLTSIYRKLGVRSRTELARKVQTF